MAKQSWNTPSYQKLVQSTAQAMLKAGTPAPLTPAWYGTTAPKTSGTDWRSLSAQTDITLGKAQKDAEKILGKQGAANLDQKTLQAISDAKTFDQKAAALGKPRKQKQSWWQRGLDVLSRPLYGVANTTKEGISKYGSGGSVADTFGAMGHGFLQGVEGKKKTTFSDVIQSTADQLHAAHQGRRGNQVVAGEGKVNPFLKYGVGLAADIGLDPTTYTGVGLVSKIGDAKQAVKTLEEAGSAVRNLEKAGIATKAETLAPIAHLAPVEGLSRKAIKGLSPEAKAIAEQAIQHQSTLSRKELRTFRKGGGGGEAALATAVPGTGKSVKEILAGLEKTGAPGTKGLTETALKLANPDITKKAAIRFGSAQLPLPGIAAGASKTGQALRKITPVDKSVAKFEELFRAKAGINPVLHSIRQETTGRLGARLVDYRKNLEGLWKVPKDVRTGAMSSWRNGALEGSNLVLKHPVTGETHNAVKLLNSEVHRLNSVANTNGIRPSELSGFLPKSYRGFANSRGQQDWLLRHIKNGTFNDPLDTLHVYNSAVEQALARRSLHDTIAKEFGISRTVKKNGKYTVSETRPLVAKGYRSVNIPGIKDNSLIFHPDVAHGIERMDAVFKNRTTTNELMRAAEKATTSLKSLFTLYNPGFHPRTAFGEIILTYLAGVPIPRIAQFYDKSIKLLKDTKGVKGNAPILKTKFGTLTHDQVRHFYSGSGIRSGYIRSDLTQASVDKAHLGRKLSAINAGVHHVSGQIEDAGRLAQFMYALSKSNARTLQEAVREAAADVLKYHLDYTAVTKTERGIAASGIPFYKWIRLSTPLMADILMHDPGRVLAVPKTLSAASKARGYDTGQGQGLTPASPDAMVPYYLRQHGAYPMFSIGKNTHYYDPASLFPVGGSAGLLDQSPLDIVNPLATKAFGYKKGKQSWPAYLATTTPQTNFARNMIAPPDPNISRLERLLMLLGNPGLVSNTPKKQSGEAKNQRWLAKQNLLKAQGK